MADAPANPFLIDDSDLVEEWGRQPGLMRRAGHDEAEARHLYNQAEARKKVVWARFYLAIRSDPTKFDLREKPTTDEIEAAVELEKDYQKVVAEVNQLKYELDLATADTTAMIDRRKALERKVELLSLNYHSEREPRPVSAAARDEIESRIRKRSRGGGYTE